MSVIAKMHLRNIAQFGNNGRLNELTCTCSNDMMAAYAGSEEDRLFTKYSPWGEMKLNQPKNFAMGAKDDVFYVMLARTEEIKNFEFPGAVGACPARIVSLTDFGDNAAKTVEICSGYKVAVEHSRGIESFNWKMSVDNDAATRQFIPGQSDAYWVALYPAAQFDRDATIRAFHSAKENSTEGASE